MDLEAILCTLFMESERVCLQHFCVLLLALFFSDPLSHKLALKCLGKSSNCYFDFWKLVYLVGF